MYRVIIVTHIDTHSEKDVYIAQDKQLICQFALRWSSPSELFILMFCSIGVQSYRWKMAQNWMIKAAWFFSTNLMYVSCHVFRLICKDQTSVRWHLEFCIKGFVAVNCSIKEHMAKYLFAHILCASVSKRHFYVVSLKFLFYSRPTLPLLLSSFELK